MSESTFLGKVLDGMEVEWVPLGEVAQYQQPTKYLVKTKNYNDEFKTPVLTAGKTFILGYTDEEHGIYKASKNHTIIFDDFTTAIKWVDFDFKAKSSAMKMITSKDEEKVLLKYIFYWMNTLPSGLIDGDHKRQWISNYSNKKIPIPCPESPDKSLALQVEIVRTLDTFTELTAKLAAELTDRKKQYHYYREQLLTFDECEVEWRALGEIGKFIRGKRFTKADYVEDGIDVIHYGEIYTHYGVAAASVLSQVRPEMESSLRYAEPGDVVITDVGETVEDVAKAVAWLGNEKVAIHDHCYAFRHSLNPKFVSYYMRTSKFITDKSKHIVRAKVKTLMINSFPKVCIPIPFPNDLEKSLAEQARIVAILDKFDCLTHSISEGLPREIELRQKQYEYYRNLLLDFPKPQMKIVA